MKLYDVPRHSYIKIIDNEIKAPVNSLKCENNEIIYFDHIDGMYSFCKDKNKNIIHLAAWTEVEITTEEEFLNQ